MKKIVIAVFSFVLVISTGQLQAQEMEDYLNDILNKYSDAREAYMEGYLQPLATSLGTSMGGAMYHRGSTKMFPRFDIGISTVMIPLPDEAKTFDTPEILTDPMGMGLPATVPTVFGTQSDNNNVIDGVDNDLFAMPMLHANVGLIANLEVTARFATLSNNDIGDLALYGAGLKYGLSDMIPIPMFPLDFALQGSYHKFTVGEFLDAGTFNMNFQASTSLPAFPLSFYGGLGFDNSSMVVKTEEIMTGSPLGEVNIDGENNIRFNLGVSFSMLFFNVHADYNIGKYNSIGAGLMVGL